MVRTPRRLLLLLVLSVPALVPLAQEGLFADFTTSRGAFTCRLEFERAPRTVANFVSLAEGTRDWVDFLGPGLSRRPFYNGTIFHRVVERFVIQGGSPNGRGNDSPGYLFRDEFHPELRHNREGILSMANSGADANGSQFFVTLGATPWLDNRHSVFGEVISGMEVVRTISSVPTGEEDRPVDPVHLHRVVIRRVGPRATAFDPAAQVPPLPAVAAMPLQVFRGESTLEMSWPVRSGHFYFMFYSPDLESWSVETLARTTGNVTFDAILRNHPRHFFFVIESQLDRTVLP